MTDFETIATGAVGAATVETLDSIPAEALAPSNDDLPLVVYLKLLIQLSIGIATILRLLKERRARKKKQADNSAGASENK